MHSHPPTVYRLYIHGQAAHMGTCTHTHSKVSEMPSEPPDDKTPSRKWPLLIQGEALYLAGQCPCWLFFVCTFLSTKSKRQNGGDSDRHAITATDMFRLTQALFISLTHFYSTIMLIWPAAYLMIWLTWHFARLPRHTDKRHFTL